MSSWKHWSRRRLLRGMLGGGAVVMGLPVLEIFGGRSARASCDTGFPKRFGFFLWGNGNLPDRWTPVGEGTGDSWALSEQLAGLEALKHKLAVVSGYSTKVDNISPHWSGACGLLTGRALVGDDDDWQVGAPTLDQVIAQELGGDTLYRSLQIGIASDGVFSFSDATTRNYGETDPFTLYQRLFGDTFVEPGSDGAVSPSLGYRRSALDAVMDDLDAMQSTLGTADRARLEQHLDGVRELELRLARLQEDPPDYQSCSRPDEPATDYPDQDGRPQLAEKSAAMAQLLAMALACDQTRVFSFQFSEPLDNSLYGDATDGHHSLTHDEPDDQPTVHAITLEIVDALATLLHTLDAVPEGEGTLLDNSIVVATSETSEGKTHSLDEVPIVIAGGGCGSIPVDQHVRSYTQDNVGKVMLSLGRAMDLTLGEWGAEDTRVSDGLSELEG